MSLGSFLAIRAKNGNFLDPINLRKQCAKISPMFKRRLRWETKLGLFWDENKLVFLPANSRDN